MCRDISRMQARGQRVVSGHAWPKGTPMNGIPARLSAASGAYFVVAVILGALGPTRSKVGLLVILSGLVALLVFLGFLHRLPSPTSSPAGRPPMVATCCGLVFLAMQASELVYIGVNYEPSTSAADAALLQRLIEATFVASTIFFGLFALSTAVVARAHHVLPGWLAWLGVTAGAGTAVAGALGIMAVESHTAVPYLAALAWTAVVSVLLATRPGQSRVEPAPSQPAADLAGAV
jgi:hypothetical protein